MAFERAGVQASIAANIHAALWEKLLFVGPFGGVGSVTSAPVAVLRSQVGSIHTSITPGAR
jgi:2-dehydropantoate 2-reductase